MFKKFMQDENGATAIEYGLIAAAMGIALVAIMPQLEGALVGLLSSLATHITTGK